MTIDLDQGAERDDLALLSPTKRLHTIAQILADGIRRRRGDARRMGESGDISALSEREEFLDRPVTAGRAWIAGRLATGVRAG